MDSIHRCIPAPTLPTKCSISAKPHMTENNHRSFSVHSQHFSIFPKPSFSSNNSVFVGQLPSEGRHMRVGKCYWGRFSAGKCEAQKGHAARLTSMNMFCMCLETTAELWGSWAKIARLETCTRSLGLSWASLSICLWVTSYRTLSYAKRYQRSSWIIQKGDVQGLKLAFTFDIKRSPTQACHTDTN